VTKLVEFLPAALEELDEGVRWFEGRHPGLGDRFLAEARATVARIAETPEACTPVVGAPGVRSRRVKDFSYRVFFVERSELVRVIAIARDSRRPRYWKKRLEG
jgi:toxin ParE1/3/4